MASVQGVLRNQFRFETTETGTETIVSALSETKCLFQFVSKQFCLFRMFRCRFETPKQTTNFCFWFTQNKPKQILFRFVSVRTEIFFSFPGHPTSVCELFFFFFNEPVLLAGIIVVYYICLRMSDKDWIGSRPRGPRHLPFIGLTLSLSFLSLLASHLFYKVTLPIGEI